MASGAPTRFSFANRHPLTPGEGLTNISTAWARIFRSLHGAQDWPIDPNAGTPLDIRLYSPRVDFRTERWAIHPDPRRQETMRARQVVVGWSMKGGPGDPDGPYCIPEHELEPLSLDERTNQFLDRTAATLECLFEVLSSEELRSYLVLQSNRRLWQLEDGSTWLADQPVWPRYLGANHWNTAFAGLRGLFKLRCLKWRPHSYTHDEYGPVLLFVMVSSEDLDRVCARLLGDRKIRHALDLIVEEIFRREGSSLPATQILDRGEDFNLLKKNGNDRILFFDESEDNNPWQAMSYRTFENRVSEVRRKFQLSRSGSRTSHRKKP